MMRDIRNLVAVIIIGRIGHVDGPLVCILAANCKKQVIDRIDSNKSRHVHAPYVNLAKVKHRPAKLLAFGIGHNLILHLIIIYIRADTYRRHHPAAARCLVKQPRVVLRDMLGRQLGIAHIGIIQIVERGHTERFLEKRAYRQIAASQRIAAKIYSRSKHTFVGRSLLPVEAVVDKRSQAAGLRLEAAEVEVGGRRHKISKPVGLGKTIHVGIKRVPSEIIGHSHTQHI